MSQPNPRDERADYYTAVDRLDTAYRELGEAADLLRDLAGVEVLREIGAAKAAINRTKDGIGA